MSQPLSFSQFVSLQEGTQSSAGSSTLFEQYIVTAWNAIQQKRSRYLLPDGTVRSGVTFPSESLFAGVAHDPYAEPAFMIAAELIEETGSRSPLVHYGSSGAQTSAEYQKWGGVDGTPKTDVYTEDGKFRWSMKASSGAVLMSGGSTDVLPTFHIAASRWRKLDEAAVVATIERILRSTLKTITPPPEADKYIDIKHKSTMSSGNGRPGFGDAANNPDLRRHFPPDVNRFLDEITLQDARIKGDLSTQLQDMFNTAEAFRREFVYEGASGDGKFKGKSPNAIANEFMKFSPEGLVSRDSFDKGPSSPTIKALSNHVEFRLRWKHGAKVRLAVDIFESTTPPRTYHELLQHHLNQLPLTEGLLDWTKSKWDNLTSWLRTFIAAVVAAVKDLLHRGFDALYEFLGMELAAVELTSIPIIT